MASASPLRLTTFPYHLKAHSELTRLSSPLPSSPILSSQLNCYDGGHLLAGKLAGEFAETEAVKWRTRVSFFPSFLRKKSRQDLKQELLEAIAPLDRGSEATSDDRERVDQITRELEAVNPTKDPLKSDLLNGKWELLYTTSKSNLQPQRPKILRPFGKIYQAINADSLRAQNMETWPYFNQIPIKAPESARGELEITYLDEEIRVSRGNKGNLFILKMVDPAYRIPS